MKIHYAILAIMLAATPVLARTGGGHYNGKMAPACMPSSDPSVPPCGVKDEAPTYFPDKLAPVDTAKAPTAPTPPVSASKKPKHKKPQVATPQAAAVEPDGWEKSGDAQAH